MHILPKFKYRLLVSEKAVLKFYLVPHELLGREIQLVWYNIIHQSERTKMI